MRRLAVLATLAVIASGCSSSSKPSADASAVVSDGGDMDVDGGEIVDGGADASCFDSPTTYLQIINACTDAEKIYKDSHPPLLNADGTLPALPQ